MQFGGRNYSTDDERSSGGAAILRLEDTDAQGLLVDGKAPISGTSTAILTATQQAALKSLVAPSDREGSAWGRPDFNHTEHWRVAAKRAAAAA